MESNLLNIHAGFQCNVCKRHDFKGKLYKCLLCKDYASCQNCYKPNAHVHEEGHMFECILTDSDAAVAFGTQNLSSLAQERCINCPQCKTWGFNALTLLGHLSTEHTDVQLRIMDVLIKSVISKWREADGWKMYRLLVRTLRGIEENDDDPDAVNLLPLNAEGDFYYAKDLRHFENQIFEMVIPEQERTRSRYERTRYNLTKPSPKTQRPVGAVDGGNVSQTLGSFGRSAVESNVYRTPPFKRGQYRKRQPAFTENSQAKLDFQEILTRIRRWNSARPRDESLAAIFGRGRSSLTTETENDSSLNAATRTGQCSQS